MQKRNIRDIALSLAQIRPSGGFHHGVTSLHPRATPRVELPIRFVPQFALGVLPPQGDPTVELRMSELHPLVAIGGANGQPLGASGCARCSKVDPGGADEIGERAFMRRIELVEQGVGTGRSLFHMEHKRELTRMVSQSRECPAWPSGSV